MPSFNRQPAHRPRILLLGGSGQVGGELLRLLNSRAEVYAPSSTELDLTDAAQLKACLHAAAPEVVINAAAYTAVDKAESDEATAFLINAQAPELIAHHCAQTDATLIHYSTEYVYDGTKPAPYVETDATAPLNVYGRSKLAGDEAITASKARHLILRTSWVYGASGHNFLKTMLRLAQSRPSLSVVDDQYGAPTSSRLLATTTLALLDSAPLADPTASGVYHLSGEGETTWYRFARAILEATRTHHNFDTANLQPIPSSQYPTPAVRPKNSLLSKGKLHAIFGITLPHWRESLNEVLAELFPH